jgi:hypothetical protein
MGPTVAREEASRFLSGLYAQWLKGFAKPRKDSVLAENQPVVGAG